ncbi:MAG: phosphopantothenoylcysteine decarboxylase [Tepidisphaeraceae bacterium]
MRVLVTAGNTRERIDEVRDWGNIFTGNTGYSIATAVAEVAEVDLLTSNRQHIAEAHAIDDHRMHASAFTTHAELKASLAALMATHKYDAIFMTAAVADYKPDRVFAVLDRRSTGVAGEEQWRVRDVQAGKVRSSHEQIAVLGSQTEKLVDLFRSEWKHAGLLVKFKLEVGISNDELIRIGQASRKASGADFLVANTLEMVRGQDSGAFLLSDAGDEWVPRAELAPRMRRIVEISGA